MAVKDLNSKVDISSYNSKMNEINETFTKSQVTSGDIHQLQKNNKNIYPKTTTGAVYEGTKTLSSILEDSIFSEPHNNETVLVPDPSIVQKVNNLENKFEEYLPLTGGNMSGNIVLNNEKAVGGLKTDGTTNWMVWTDAQNRTFLGSTKNPLNLGSSENPVVHVGTKGIYELYHAGNKPLPDDIGAVPNLGNATNYDIRVGGTITVHADQDNTSTDEFLALKAGGNWLKLSSTGSGSQSPTALVFNSKKIYHEGYKPTAFDLGAVALNSETVQEIDSDIKINGDLNTQNIYSAKGINQTSDMRMKSDIRDIDDEIFFNMIKNTGIHSYVLNYKDMPEGITQEEAPEEQVHVGIIAQEMDQYEGSRYILNVDENGQYSVNNYNLTSAVMAALKVEISKREELQNEVKELKNELKEIKNLLNSNK